MTRQASSVLLIDDNWIDRERIARLVRNGLTLVQAATAAEGCAIFEASRPDCVLLDYWLPDAEGLEILHWLVARQAAVIVFTGQGSEAIAVEVMKNGAQDYLIKDEVSSDSLRRSIEGAIHRRALETALKRSESYNRALLEAIPDTIFRIHRDGIFLDVIPGKGASAHGSPGELVGSAVREALPPDIAARFMDAIEQAFGEGSVQGLEYELDAQGARYIYEARITVCGKDEVLAITRDMTEQKNLEQRMRASQRMEAVGRLAGGIAHDFGNVLTLIQGYTGLLLEELDEDGRMHKDLSVMWDATERGANLIRQLLAFSSRQAQELEIVDLNQAILAMSKMLGRVIRESIMLELELDSQLGHIEVDSTQLDQILLNLAVNARDAMPEGGTLTIETMNVELASSDATRLDARAGRYVLLEVRDTGTGMDQETRSRIFEPFFTTKPQGQGTGLGLATVYGIVKQSKGVIEVASEPGQGTTFDIYFPRVEGEVTRLPRSCWAPSVLTGNETVLLVEDEEHVRRAVHGILERNGYRVLEAGGGSEALSVCMAHEGPIHLLLTDMVMPQVSGKELADSLSAALPDLQVLYMTGYVSDILAEHGMARGDLPMLEKPFTPEALLRKVREVLDRPRAPGPDLAR